MKFIVIVISVLLLAGYLSGCASFLASQNPNATPQMKQAAACLDAKVWLNTVSQGLQTAPQGSSQWIWYNGLLGAAQAQVNGYCTSPLP